MYTQFAKIAALFSCFNLINGHGYLLKPLSRNSLSLEFQDVKANVNRMGLNCGGANHQWDVCDGRCGVCGDPCDAAKKSHETGGIYFDGRIVEKYQAGQHVNVSVRITSHHKGYFTFRLAKATPEGRVTQAELDMHLLKVKKGNTHSDRYDLPNKGNTVYSMHVKLPNGFTCNRCVLQWYYTTGNNWCDTKCTPRDRKAESFVNCADIEIIGGQGSNQGNSNQGNSNQGNSNQGNINQGSNNQGRNNQGNSNQGSNNQGNSNQGSNNQGSNNQGNRNQGSSNQGKSNQGSNNQGKSNQGSNNQGNRNGAGNNQASSNNVNGQSQTTNEIVERKKCVKAIAEWCNKNCNHTPRYCPVPVCSCDWSL